MLSYENLKLNNMFSLSVKVQWIHVPVSTNTVYQFKQFKIHINNIKLKKS